MLEPRVEEIFHEVADLSVDDRTAYFARHNIDGETRREVKALLEFDSPAIAFPLEKNIADLAQQTLSRFGLEGALCGPYRLGSLLGSGGMGSVYLAERIDGEVAQRVAIKLLRPGVDSSLLYERFLAERQILANLSHPNIARLLDAGRREDGQPYLVMEYIEGKPIDIFTADFSIGSKVRLFLKVCAAVAYLHRNLVVHRDLKPANILVTAEGEPKLLDFGIAKILDLVNDPAVTGMPLLTPDYASPEQVSGRSAATTTDIYSLGAVLYKLITGVSPHRFDDDESVHGVISVICSGRIVPPGKLLPAVKRDLEIILLKLLRKEPQERYVTVEQLAEDLENYLDSRPIRARKGDTWYQVLKFLRRRWLPVAAVGLAITCLSAGMFLANRERTVAQQRFQQVRQLADRFIELHDDVAELPGSTRIREKMVTTALDYLHNLSRTSGNDPRLLSEIGEVYVKVAHAQGSPGQPNLGLMEDALSSLRNAVEFEGRAAALDPAYRVNLALVRTELSYLAMLNGYFAEARKNLELAAASLDRIRLEDPSDVELLIPTARVAGDRGDLSELEGNFKNELAFFEESARLQYEYLRRKPGNTARVQAYRATTLVAWALADNKRYDEALSTLHQQAPVITALLAAEPENQTYLRQRMAAANYEGQIYDSETGNCLGKPWEAVAAFRLYIETARKLAAADPNNASARLSLASANYKLSWPLGKIDPPQALRVAQDSVNMFREEQSRHPHDRVIRSGRSRALRHLAYAYQRTNKLGQARSALQQSIDLQQQVVNEAPADKNEREQLAISLRLLSTLSAKLPSY